MNKLAPRPWHRRLSSEIIREIALVAIGLLIVAWLFFGGSSQPEPQHSWAGRPLVHTQSALIVPPIPGVANSGVKKAPGDMNELQAKPGQTQGGKQPVYVYSGSKSPSVVVVSVIDDVRFPSEYVKKIIENRIEYALAHDYGVFIKYSRDYSDVYTHSNGQNPEWSGVAAAREAMAAFPHAQHFWYLDQTAIIMNPLVDIEREFFDASHLRAKMLSNAHVVRSSDIIKVRKVQPNDVDLIMTRDDVGLTPLSFIYDNSVANTYWLEFWLDPLLREYQNFHHPRDALLHLMQWHTALLKRAAVVSPKLLAAFAESPSGDLKDELSYTDGDFTVVFRCDYNTEPCKKQFQKFWAGRGRVKRAS